MSSSAFGRTRFRSKGRDLTAAALEGVALAFADGLDVLIEKGGTVGEDQRHRWRRARLPYWGQLVGCGPESSAGVSARAAGKSARLSARRGWHALAVSGERAEDVCTAPPDRSRSAT